MSSCILLHQVKHSPTFRNNAHHTADPALALASVSAFALSCLKLALELLKLLELLLPCLFDSLPALLLHSSNLGSFRIKQFAFLGAQDLSKVLLQNRIVHATVAGPTVLSKASHCDSGLK
jgi:hypothetical protein